MYLSEELQRKWQPVLDHEDLPPITGKYQRAVTAQLLENEETALRENGVGGGSFLTEAPLNVAGTHGDGGTGGVREFDPVLISLVRRAMPNLIAYDICGVQPMTGPTGLVFALRAAYSDQASTPALGNEALYNEANTAYSAGPNAGVHAGTTSHLPADSTAPGIGRDVAEIRGGDGPGIPQMGFQIDKVSVVALSRALKAEYTVELAQDLKAIHGLDAETELANILSAEILAEINREVVRTINKTAKRGAQSGTATANVFNLDTDANGRWSVERFKGMMFQLEREANQIAKDTRRGKGNIVICSSDVASALSMAGALDYAPALKDNLNVDDTGNTFAGVLNGRFKVFIDPYFRSNFADTTTLGYGEEYFTVGYKGSSAYDAGLFYCPYVPLQMVRAVGENDFQPKIGFKTRYGLVANPFATTDGDGSVDSNSADVTIPGKQNMYYRTVRVANLM